MFSRRKATTSVIHYRREVVSHCSTRVYNISEQSNFGKMSPVQLIIFGAFQPTFWGQSLTGESDIATLQCPFGSKLTGYSSYRKPNGHNKWFVSKDFMSSLYCTTIETIAICAICKYALS